MTFKFLSAVAHDIVFVAHAGNVQRSFVETNDNCCATQKNDVLWPMFEYTNKKYFPFYKKNDFCRIS